MPLQLPKEELIELPKARFPRELHQEASRLEIPDQVFYDRLPVQGFTVDGALSRDLDDAIWLEKLPNGGYLVQVSIADVDELIKIASPLDQEALSRTTSLYFPSHNIPMFPRVLSENRLSLLEGKARPTLTVSIRLDPDLNIRKVDLQKTFLTSTRKLSHGEFHLGKSIGNSQLRLLDYHNLARELNQKRRHEESLAYQQFSGGISTDEEGLPSAQLPTHGHLVVQEFMILANQSVAKLFSEQKISAPFRNHSLINGHAPTRIEIIDIIEKNSNYLQLVDNLRELYHKFLNAASYDESARGHYGLNLDNYLYFTSPIRRYADLINHRLAKSLIDQTRPPYTQTEISELCLYLNARTRRLLTLRSAEERQKSPNSLQQYKDNYRLLSIKQDRQKFDGVDKLLKLLHQHSIGNVRFEFHFSDGINLMLTCTAWIKHQREKIEVSVAAHADKYTLKDLAAKKLAKKIRNLLKNSPDFFQKEEERHGPFHIPEDPNVKSVVELYQFCHNHHLLPPLFHYESWSGNSDIVSCNCQITELISVHGYGHNPKRAKQDAARKMLNYLSINQQAISAQAYAGLKESGSLADANQKAASENEAAQDAVK